MRPPLRNFNDLLRFNCSQRFEKKKKIRARFSTTANSKQGAHIPTAWPVPYACAQPYPPGGGNHADEP